MSTSRHRLNRRKRALNLLMRQMKKHGFLYKKAISNTITFQNPSTGEKKRETLEY